MWEACFPSRCPPEPSRAAGRTPLRARRLAAVCLFGCCSLVAASCQRSHAPDAAVHEGRLTIKGSDTMVHLVSMWAEAYMACHPDVDVSVTGGGSGTGFAALINGTTDVCAASRAILTREREAARQQQRNLSESVVARDGLAIIVHPDNPVTVLSLAQLRAIYEGAWDNWQQVGGPDLPIVVLSRDSSSGTYLFFQEQVLGRRDFRRDARLLAATAAIVEDVSNDVGAIGYVGLAYARDAGDTVKVVPISPAPGAAAIEPSLETVTSGVYPLARPLRFYVAEPHDARADAFIAFCLSPAGQEIVRQSGYVVAD
ncbi:MAG: phosphate ABC transporter substrate-binding protein [Pirellulaceae bacterium]|jgi:phosphate transport system substrate-binding protein|nr:phosphate ABC transporter substrate-binding protein [Pirellulaceae bacterium]